MLMIVQKNVQNGRDLLGKCYQWGVKTAATSIVTIFEGGQDRKQWGRGCRVGWMGNIM